MSSEVLTGELVILTVTCESSNRTGFNPVALVHINKSNSFIYSFVSIMPRLTQPTLTNLMDDGFLPEHVAVVLYWVVWCWMLCSWLGAVCVHLWRWWNTTSHIPQQRLTEARLTIWCYQNRLPAWSPALPLRMTCLSTIHLQDFYLFFCQPQNGDGNQYVFVCVCPINISQSTEWI